MLFGWLKTSRRNFGRNVGAFLFFGGLQLRGLGLLIGCLFGLLWAVLVTSLFQLLQKLFVDSVFELALDVSFFLDLELELVLELAACFMSSLVELRLVNCNFNGAWLSLSVSLLGLVEILPLSVLLDELLVLEGLGDWLAFIVKLLSIFVAHRDYRVGLLLFVRDGVI